MPRCWPAPSATPSTKRAMPWPPDRPTDQATTAAGGGAGPVTTIVDLEIGGMTCASCAARVEKKLNRMAGVQASVNFATERVRVSLAAGVEVSDAIATVESTGFTARLPMPARPVERAGSGDPSQLRRRLLVSAVLAVPVLL